MMPIPIETRIEWVQVAAQWSATDARHKDRVHPSKYEYIHSSLARPIAEHLQAHDDPMGRAVPLLSGNVLAGGKAHTAAVFFARDALIVGWTTGMWDIEFFGRSLGYAAISHWTEAPNRGRGGSWTVSIEADDSTLQLAFKKRDGWAVPLLTAVLREKCADGSSP